MKKCTRCRKEKEPIEFISNNKELRTCMECRNKMQNYNKIWKENNKDTISLYNKHINLKKKNGKEIVVVYAKKINTNEDWFRFNTQLEAAKSLNLQPSNVNKVIKGISNSTGGYTFQLKMETIELEYKEWDEIKTENDIKNNCKGVPSQHRILHEEKEGVMGKQCCKCKKWNPLTDFNKCKSHWDNLRIECKTCLQKWRKNNRYILNENHKKYEKERKIKDPNFKLIKTLRSRLLSAINRKNSKKLGTTIELTGCSIQELKTHLESKFKEGMTWQNHGKWHIDHIRPCSSFNLTDKIEQQKCFHYTNLQPLWANENLSKGNRYID
jgi:hypothetical protein